MASTNVIFFGSFQAYSALVLQGLHNHPDLHISGVVTTPPAQNAKGDRLPNPVQLLAQELHLPVVTPKHLTEDSLQELEQTCGKPELLVTAGYGKLLPVSWLNWPSLAAVNLHFSLLPKFRGANPAEWALLFGETETGVTLIEMSSEFDKGAVIASASLPIAPTDTRETLYHKLYTLGGQVLPQMLSTYIDFRRNQTISDVDSDSSSKITWHLPPITQSPSPTPYAARFSRADGFIDWKAIVATQQGKTASSNLASSRLQEVLQYTHHSLDAQFIAQAVRALAGFPSVWTIIPTAKGEKRMKLLSCQVVNHQLVLEDMQIEGKNPTRWAESKNILSQS